ncbi:hypothetical protein Cantr_03554 [Candida viswanathii]|uniref:TRIP4/RQT4 C2HC5-type zinc finger domain-containing protein n=1 Tax=Candida viswanathii TaxID=5486 RepID=A0A367YL35_9ASCO|nr:hypothetical protein Cantr_03554 [Candida viswanathii]
MSRNKRKKNLVNLQDIESILTELETEETTHDPQVRRVCNCMARRHPLFEIAPNCLNSTGGGAVAPKNKKKIVVKMNAGEKAFKMAEKEIKKTKEEDVTAKEEADTAEKSITLVDSRGKSIEPQKQQRIMREGQVNKDRKSRGKRTVEMSIKDGKVTMVEKFVSHKEETSAEEKQLEESIRIKKQQASSANDLVWDYDKDRLKWEKPIFSVQKILRRQLRIASRS